MSYEPTLWAKGDKITAEKLNKAENAIAELSVQQEEKEAQQFMIVRALLKEEEEDLEPKSGEQVRGQDLQNLQAETYELDKTWAELKEAQDNGAFIIGVQKNGLLSSVHVELFEHEGEESEYVVSMSDETYMAFSEDGYPYALEINQGENGSVDIDDPSGTELK